MITTVTFSGLPTLRPMLLRTASFLLLSTAVLANQGCQEDDSSQANTKTEMGILLELSASSAVIDQISSFEVSASGTSNEYYSQVYDILGGTPFDRSSLYFAAKESAAPTTKGTLSPGFTPIGSSGEEVTITVSGIDKDNATVFSRKAILTIPSDSRRLSFAIDEGCLNSICDAKSTCIDSICVSAIIDTTALPTL